MHVSRPHRGRGVARRLIAMLAEQATALGATALYISATPTRNTVDAYVRIGARLADPPDPVRLAPRTRRHPPAPPALERRQRGRVPRIVMRRITRRWPR